MKGIANRFGFSITIHLVWHEELATNVSVTEVGYFKILITALLLLMLLLSNNCCLLGCPRRNLAVARRRGRVCPSPCSSNAQCSGGRKCQCDGPCGKMCSPPGEKVCYEFLVGRDETSCVYFDTCDFIPMRHQSQCEHFNSDDINIHERCHGNIAPLTNKHTRLPF